MVKDRVSLLVGILSLLLVTAGVLFCVPDFRLWFVNLLQLHFNVTIPYDDKVGDPSSDWLLRFLGPRIILWALALFCMFILRAGRNFMRKALTEARVEMKSLELRRCVKPLLCLWLIYIIALLSVFRANYATSVDMHRSLSGVRFAGDWSRYISDLLSMFINADNSLTDISPLTQLLACLVMAAAGIILVRIFTPIGKKMSAGALMSSILLGINPYFICNLAIKFDAPYFALSLAASIAPFLFFGQRRAFIASSVIGLLVMCMTYQAASGVYILMTLFICFREWRTQKTDMSLIKKQLFWAIGSYIGTLLFFRIALMMKENSYGVSTSLPLPSQLMSRLAGNAVYFYGTINADFNLLWKILCVLLLLGFSVYVVRTSKRNKAATLSMLVILFFCAMLLCFGVYILLTIDNLEPRYLFGFTTLLALVAVELAGQKGLPKKLVPAALVWCFFTFSFTYGNVLADHCRYREFYASMLTADLSKIIPSGQEDIQIQLQGDIGDAPVTRHVIKHYPLIRKMAPVDIGGKNLDDYTYLIDYFNLNSQGRTISGSLLGADGSNNFTALDMPLKTENIYYTIKSDGAHILIVFK
jgi:hypothetical protein